MCNIRIFSPLEWCTNRHIICGVGGAGRAGSCAIRLSSLTADGMKATPPKRFEARGWMSL